VFEGRALDFALGFNPLVAPVRYYHLETHAGWAFLGYLTRDCARVRIKVEA
jgi:hypothetical protein